MNLFTARLFWSAARSVRTRRFGSWWRFKAAKAARTHRPRRTPKKAAPVSSSTNTALGHHYRTYLLANLNIERCYNPTAKVTFHTKGCNDGILAKRSNSVAPGLERRG